MTQSVEPPASHGGPVTVQEKLDAQTAGHEAAVSDQPPGVNPYRLSDLLDQDPERVKLLQLMWIRGYQQARAEVEAIRAAQQVDRGEEGPA